MKQRSHPQIHTHPATILGFFAATHRLTVKAIIGLMLDHRTNENRQRNSFTQLEVRPLEGICHAPHPHPFGNEKQTSERSDDFSPLSNGRLCAGARAKFPRTFAHSVGLNNKIVLSSLVCTCVYTCVYWCVCIEVWSSHTPNAAPISPLVTSVEPPYYALHPPLPASEPVLSSWNLVVLCPLVAPGVTGITDRYDNRLVVPGTR